MDRQLMFYFGTNGSSDYVPIPVREGDILPLYPEHDAWENLERTLSNLAIKKYTFFRGYFLGTEWTLYLKPWSVEYDEWENLNGNIEKYLAMIDKKYGTSWCPTGALRV